MDEILAGLASNGPAWALLVLAIIAVWRAMVWIGPRIEKLLNAHVSLVDTLRVASTRQTEILEEHTTILKAVERNMTAVEKHMNNIGQLTEAGR